MQMLKRYLKIRQYQIFLFRCVGGNVEFFEKKDNCFLKYDCSTRRLWSWRKSGKATDVSLGRDGDGWTTDSISIVVEHHCYYHTGCFRETVNCGKPSMVMGGRNERLTASVSWLSIIVIIFYKINFLFF